MLKKPNPPKQDPETGEWRYRGKWFDDYPSEELEKDDAAYDEACDREIDRKRVDRKYDRTLDR